MSATTAVEENTADKTEANEGKLDIAQLVEAVSCEVLGNPYLTAIIEAAPSPKAADEYMKWLGWPNELARRLRQGVYLYQKCRKYGDGLWSDFKRVKVRLSEMFSFGCSVPDFDFRDYQVLWSDAVKLGQCEVDYKWPLFLREFKISHLECTKRHIYITSVDNHGLKEYGNNSFENADNINDEFAFQNFGHMGTSAFRGYRPAGEDHNVLTLQMPKDHNFAFCEIGKSRIKMKTKILLIKSTSRESLFPIPYKLLQISRSFLDGEMWSEETIRILLRLDWGPLHTRQMFGGEWVVFERVVPVSNRVEVALQARYQIFPKDNKLDLRDQSQIAPIQVRLRNKEGDRVAGHFGQDAIGRVSSSLSVFAGKLFCVTVPRITLEDVSGIELALNPPKELVDLFIK